MAHFNGTHSSRPGATETRGDAIAVRAGRDRPAPRGAREEATGRGSWLLCRAGTILTALPIEHVIEIMRVLPIERLAGVPGYVGGVSIIRGEPVPVVDLGAIIGGKAVRHTRLVAIKTATRTIALAVDEVIGVAGIDLEACGRLPPLLRDAAADTISAVGARDSELLLFLRTGRIVPEDVLAKLDPEGAIS